MTQQPIPFDMLPGIQRDGTQLDSQRALDALWCRWRLGRPRKMGGMLRLTDTLAAIPRKIHQYYDGANTIVHVGTSSSLQQFVINSVGTVISSANRTPAAFVAGVNVGWTLDAIFDTTSNAVQLVAHAVADLQYSSSTAQTVPYIGILTDTTPLAQFSNPSPSSGVWTQPMVAGGIVCVQPFVFDFDASGLVQWSAPNLPLYLGVTQGSTGAGQARISAQKIFAGMPLRGGGAQQPAVIFWSASEVITGVFVGSSSGEFAFSTLSPSSSILSTDVVVEYDGLYFWAGVDRFLVFNGTVQEVPNPQNQDWFFDNLNRQFAGKCFAFKVPRYGEIWFCAPLFGATECSHAVIYNVREQCWYDTVLPDGGRSCGAYSAQTLHPLLGGIVSDGTGFKLWAHEIGTDEVDGTTTNAVRSYFESRYFGAPTLPNPSDVTWSVQMFEPDITQTGDMNVYLIGRSNSRSPSSTTVPETLRFTPNVPQEQAVAFKNGYRMFKVHIESNVVGGSYVCGKNLLHVEPTTESRIFS